MSDKGPDQKPSELQALLDAAEPAALLDGLFCSAPAGAVIVRAPDGKVLYVSDYAALLLGRLRSDIEGTIASETPWLMRGVDAEGRRLPDEEAPLVRALRGEAVIGFEAFEEAADGELIPFAISASPIRNSRGDLIGAIGSFLDLRPRRDFALRAGELERRVAELERSLSEEATHRETLFRELTHRVKNHLQIMSGLVSMEARDPKLSAAGLAELVNGRLRTLAVVYDNMTRAGVGARVGATPFVSEVCRPYASETVNVATEVEPDDLTFTSDQAGPIGMLINEALSNSFKHAFPHRGGRVWVALRRVKPGRLRLEIADDGVGWRPRETSRVSHGLDLMRVFAQQLRAELEFGDRPGGGVVVAAELPELGEETQSGAAVTAHPVSPSRERGDSSNATPDAP